MPWSRRSTDPALAEVRALDGHPAPERLQRLAALARRTEGTPVWAGLLAQLEASSATDRDTARFLVAVSGDLGHLRAALSSGTPVPPVDRATTLATAVRLGLDAATIVDLLPDLSVDEGRTLLRAVRRRGSTAVVDVLVPAVRSQWGDHAAAGLLAAASEALVAGVLDDLGWAVPAWAPLARRHPGPVLDHVEHLLDTTPRAAWTELLHTVVPAVGEAAAAAPDRVFALLERFTPDPLPSALLGGRRTAATLARHDPARWARLLLLPGSPPLTPDRAVLRSLAVLPDDVLGQLAARQPWHRLSLLLRRLPPPRRARVLAAAAPELDPSVHVPLLDLLHWRDRHATAAALLTRRDVVDDPTFRLTVVARLPFPEAEPELVALTAEPTADRRALGYRLLVTAAIGSRDPAIVAQVIGRLDRARREQDPVRLSGLSALEAVPGDLVDAAGAAALVSLAATAVSARDSSVSTRACVTRLATSLTRTGLVDDRAELVAAGSEILGALGAGSARLQLGHLRRDLPRSADDRVLRTLLPRLEAEARTGDYATTLALASGLGARRAERLDPLQDLLARATRAAADGVVRSAVGHWLEPHATRGSRVEQLLAADSSMITLHPVSEAVARTRTDLLDRVLGSPSRGRFLAEPVVFLPSIGRHVALWAPHQVDAFRDLAARIAESSVHPAGQRTMATRELVGLPGATSVLHRLVGSPDVAVAATAVAALGTLPPGGGRLADDPRLALPDLYAALEADQVHVAVPALRSVLRRLPPAEAAPAVQRLLASSRVTVRKDAVRLLVDLRVPSASADLQRLWADRATHRDVRRAVVPVLADRLDEDWAWSVVEEAFADAGTTSAPLAVGTDVIAPRHRERWAALLLEVTENPDDVIARTALAGLPRWLVWAPSDAGPRLAATVTDLAGTGRWRLALVALARVAALASDAALLFATSRSLVEAGAAETALVADPALDAGADRDRPARRRLEQLVARTSRLVTEGLPAPAVGPVVSVLADTAWTRDLAVDLAAEAIDWDDHPGPGLARVLAAVDTPGLAHRAAAGVASGLRAVVAGLSEDALDEALALVPADGPAPQALVRHALVEVLGHHRAWPERWRAELRTLRRHPDADVARAAVATTWVHE